VAGFNVILMGSQVFLSLLVKRMQSLKDGLMGMPLRMGIPWHGIQSRPGIPRNHGPAYDEALCVVMLGNACALAQTVEAVAA
jgi:hypothetical protein